MKEEIGVEILKKLKEVFDKCQVPFWLDFGTCLGAVREKRIIEWDKDIDIGVKSENWNDALVEELGKQGFKVKAVRRWKLEGMLNYVGTESLGRVSQASVYYKGVHICLQVWIKGLDGRRYFSSNPKRMMVIEDSFVSNQKEIDFYDTKFFIPLNTDAYLSYIYGSGWKTPNDGYIGSEEHKKNQDNFRIYI